MATDTTDGTSSSTTPVAETRISCHSKRSQEVANERVFAAIDGVLEKNREWSEDQKDRIRRRFREVYKNTLHENSTIDGQSWAESVDDADTTKEFEPVDLKRKGDAEQMAADLDGLIVSTVAKRKGFPPRLTQQMAKKLRCLHTALEQYKPVFDKSIEDHSPILSAEDEEDIASRVSTASNQVSVLSRLLPDLEDKSSRLQETVNIHASLASNKTHRVITKPLKDEAKVATSLTPLRAQALADETPTADVQNADAVPKRQLLTEHIHNHPIKRYKPKPTNAVKPT